MQLVKSKVIPILDPGFRPAALACRNFLAEARACSDSVPVCLAIEQADGSVFHHHTRVFDETHPLAKGNFRFVERLIKFLLWGRGGFRVYVQGPESLAIKLQDYYQRTPTGQFDSEIMGNRIYGRAFEVLVTKKVPDEKSSSTPLGRHLDGCRIGFDLGGSDRKVAALINGECVFSEETAWSPITQSDPAYHFDGIMDSLLKAAAHLPRVDAIGGSVAGVYVNNRVKVASLFRGISPADFKSRIEDIFLDLRKVWNHVPFEVANDGEVTALAGSMSLNDNSVLGLAFGTSTAGGYVNSEGNITSWLNEFAFVPVDYQTSSAVDEWSGDYGCGVQFFSQQAVNRLLKTAKIEVESNLGVPERLKFVQDLMAKNDVRARQIYETLGTYLGYQVAHFTAFYEIKHLLILGRVTTGEGGNIIVEQARNVLRTEFPELAEKLAFHMPDEKEKRHGQAIAAASLPSILSPV